MTFDTDDHRLVQYVLESPESIMNAVATNVDDESPSLETLAPQSPIRAVQPPDRPFSSGSPWQSNGQLLDSNTPPYRSPEDHVVICRPSQSHTESSRSDGTLWPVLTKEEGFIFRHFVTELAKWVSITYTICHTPHTISLILYQV